jgi:hypothetical protein
VGRQRASPTSAVVVIGDGVPGQSQEGPLLQGDGAVAAAVVDSDVGGDVISGVVQ